MTGVNNNANYGLDERLASLMKSLHAKVDQLIEQIDKIKKEGEEFKEGYEK